jgi:hypothetical protein
MHQNLRLRLVTCLAVDPFIAPRALRAALVHDTIGTLVGLQAEYAAWLAALPANLCDGPIADVVQAICELDRGELPAIEPLRGFGRD